jgi:TRAP-type C4-dicarboxylate transport system substrate-binding protein
MLLDKMRTLAFITAIAVSITASAGIGLADDRRIATLAPEGSTWMKILTKGAKEIDEATDGRVTTTSYPNGVQGDERYVVRKIRLKQLDGAAVTSIGLGMIDESIRVLELPMLFRDEGEMEYVTEKMWPYFQDKFADKGFRLGPRAEVGWVYFMSKSKVNSLDDLRDAKIWVWQDDQLSRAMFKELEVSGVPLGVPDVLSSLISGRINACYGSPLAAVALQWNTEVSYMTSMPLSYALGATVMRQEVWDTYSEADQAIQEKILTKMAKRLRRKVRRDNETAQESMVKKGIEVVQTPKSMVAEFQRASENVWKSLTGKLYSQDELDMVLDLRAEYRAKQNK